MDPEWTCGQCGLRRLTAKECPSCLVPRTHPIHRNPAVAPADRAWQPRPRPPGPAGPVPRWQAADQSAAAAVPFRGRVVPLGGPSGPAAADPDASAGGPLPALQPPGPPRGLPPS